MKSHKTHYASEEKEKSGCYDNCHNNIMYLFNYDYFNDLLATCMIKVQLARFPLPSIAEYSTLYKPIVRLTGGRMAG